MHTKLTANQVRENQSLLTPYEHITKLRANQIHKRKKKKDQPLRPIIQLFQQNLIKHNKIY